MQNLGGAVIPMQKSFDKLTFLVGDAAILSGMESVPALPMFSEKAVQFLSALSKQLLSDKETRSYVDVVSYAYWIRKASIETAKEKHHGYQNRMGRGVSFHIAPSNVPVNFAVSMTSAILAGNACVIRLSNKQFRQVDLICDAMNELLSDEFACLKNYFCFVRYEHNEEVTQMLSDMCDVRIVWGGNQTIEAIRRAKLPPRTIELAFADRHSIAVIDADYYLTQDAKEVAKGFYTDTYYTDQNACSSPRLVVWMGEETQKARERFWESLSELVRDSYNMKPIQAVDKYTSMCMIGMSDTKAKKLSDDNFVNRVEVEKLSGELMDYKNGGGYFFEYEAKQLDEIVPVLTKQCQTVSVLGIDKKDVKEIVYRYGVRGVDRIVSLGQTMGLEFVWDGYQMIEAMSRVVYVGED